MTNGMTSASASFAAQETLAQESKSAEASEKRQAIFTKFFLFIELLTGPILANPAEKINGKNAGSEEPQKGHARK